MQRQGTILILVAGIAALMATMALAFLVNMRRDAEESIHIGREAQARIMLIAACNYIQEASRLGYDNPATAAHEEAFGWIDVRDGKIGPKIVEGDDDDSRFPRHTAVRCPMHVMKRTPYAVASTVSPNPISTTAGDPAYLMPYLRNPDPMPAVANGWTGYPGATVNAANWDAFAQGDRTPRQRTAGKSWFRVYRETADTFVVTCGAGASLGFKDWDEVDALGQTATFAGGRSEFEEILRGETRLFYLVQWSPAVATSELHNPHPVLNVPAPQYVLKVDHFVSCAMNTSHSKFSSPAMVTVNHSQNMVGTIKWVQRLHGPPTNY
jgi:hypothetical protein